MKFGPTNTFARNYPDKIAHNCEYNDAVTTAVGWQNWPHAIRERPAGRPRVKTHHNQTFGLLHPPKSLFIPYIININVLLRFLKIIIVILFLHLSFVLWLNAQLICVWRNPRGLFYYDICHTKPITSPWTHCSSSARRLIVHKEWNKSSTSGENLIWGRLRSNPTNYRFPAQNIRNTI